MRTISSNIRRRVASAHCFAWAVLLALVPSVPGVSTAVAAAELSVDVPAPILRVAPGGLARFEGLIRNPHATAVHVNGASSSLDAGFDLGDAFAAFLSSCPESLASQEAWAGTMMEFTVPLDAVVGSWVFSVALSGGASADDSLLVAELHGRLEIFQPACLPAIAAEPQGQDVDEGAPAFFEVVTVPSENVAFQWRRDGVSVDDDSGHVGATTSRLEILQATPGDAGYYDVEMIHACGSRISISAPLVVQPTVGVDPVPASRLSLIVPNPLRAGDEIVLALPRAEDVTVALHDVLGRRVLRLRAVRFPPGESRIVWHGRDEQGGSVPAGIYFLRVRTPSGDLVRKVVLTTP